MPTQTKEIIDGTVHREKALCLPRRCEPPHLPFLVPRRLMGDSRAVVLPTALAMSHTGQELPARCPITASFSVISLWGAYCNPFNNL